MMSVAKPCKEVAKNQDTISSNLRLDENTEMKSTEKPSVVKPDKTRSSVSLDGPNPMSRKTKAELLRTGAGSCKAKLPQNGIDIIRDSKKSITLDETTKTLYQNNSLHKQHLKFARNKAIDDLLGNKQRETLDNLRGGDIEIEVLQQKESSRYEKNRIDQHRNNGRRASLESDSVDHDEEYGSDDTSTSSADDETMPGLEEVPFPHESMSKLGEREFDVWRLGRDSMIDHMEYMYHDLGVTQAWRIPRATLRMFLLGVRERYQDNPYHNFKHCFCVAQMAYSMVCKLKLRHILSVDYLGMLLTSAICHDVDHPGLNNGYHTHARSPLAILYNYKSILEQHHFAVTCRILTSPERNIFKNVPNRDDILNGVRELILATDLALHKEIVETYKRHNASGFDFKERSHVLSLLKIIIKCADVSNEVRPENIATPWVERLFAEYFEQSAREKRERLPVTPYMDPEQVDVTDSQEGFIRGMMLPMYTELGNLIVDARLYYLNPLREALIRYEIQKGGNRI